MSSAEKANLYAAETAEARVQSTPPGKVEFSVEAEQVKQVLRRARGKLVVAYGKPGSGKTEFFRRWVVPLMDRSESVYFGECSPELPTRMERLRLEVEINWNSPPGGTLILDGFDKFLALPEQSRREGMEKILSAVRARAGELTIALIVSDESLGAIYGLRQFVPDIAANVVELPEVSLAEGLKRLAAAEPGVSYQPEVLELLTQDLKQFKANSATPLLMQKVHSYMLRGVPEQAERQIGTAQYESAGGLPGILDEYLRTKLAELQDICGADAYQAGLSIMEDIVRAPGADLNLQEIEVRLAISKGLASQVLECLRGPQGLLKTAGLGRLKLVLPQLSDIIQQEIEIRQHELRYAQNMLLEGLRSWRELGSLLPKRRYEELHDLRRELRMDASAAAFMLACALRFAEGGNFGAAKYWAARVPEGSERITALLRSFSDQRPEARIGAIRLLAEYYDPNVEERLCRAALEDGNKDVRHEAISSLRRGKAGQFRVRMEQAAQDPVNPYCRNAIEALSIFPDQRTIQILQSIVALPGTDPSSRKLAIETLAALAIPESVKALVSISLNDETEEDRAGAATALETINSQTLQTSILKALWGTSAASKEAGRRGVKQVLAAAGKLLLGVVVAAANVAIPGISLLLLKRYRLGAIFLALSLALWASLVWVDWIVQSDVVALGWFGLFVSIIVVNQLATFWTAYEDKRASLSRFTLSDALGYAMFGVSVLTTCLVFHGLAHLLLKRVRRAFVLFGLEMLGFVCSGALFFYRDLFTPSGLPGTTLWQRLPYFLAFFYFVSAFGLFVGTYLWDVIGGFLAVRSKTRLEAEQRRTHTCLTVLKNTAAVSVVLSGLKNPDAREQLWAKSLLRRFAHIMPQSLLLEHLGREGPASPRALILAVEHNKDESSPRILYEMFRGAGSPLRKLIVQVLTAMPSESSLQYLKRLLPDAGPQAYIRYYVAAFRYRLRLAPKPLVVLFTCLLPLGLLFLYEGVATVQNPARPEIKQLESTVARKIVNSPQWREKKRISSGILTDEDNEVVSRSRFLADLYPTQSVKKMAELFSFVNDQRDEEGVLNDVRQTLAKSLGLAALGAERGMEHRYKAMTQLERITEHDKLAEELNKAGAARQKALDTLRTAARASDAYIRNAAFTGLLQVAGQSLKRPSTTEGHEGQDEEQRALDALMSPRAAQQALDILEPQLMSPNLDLESRIALVHALEANGSKEALDALKEFAIKSVASITGTERVDKGSAGAGLQLEQQAREILQVQLIAVDTLISMESREARSAVAKIADAATEPEVLERAKAGLKHETSFSLYAQAVDSFNRNDYANAEQMALSAIREDPQYRRAYSLLMQTYLRQNRLRQAEAQFEQLRRLYPASVYPSIYLTYLYHDYTGPTDATGYEKAYEINDRLLKEVTNPVLKESIRANLVESCLTTGRYEEAVRQARELAPKVTNPEYRMVMRLMAYIALVGLGKYQDAINELENLESVIQALSPGTKMGWSYNGTLSYIRRSAIPDPMKGAVVKLVSEINERNKTGGSAKDLSSASVFDENRNVLEALLKRTR